MQINFFSDIMINKLLTKIIYRNNENKWSIPIKKCICKYIYTDKYFIIEDDYKNTKSAYDICILLIPPIITINKFDQICLNIVNYTEKKTRGYRPPLKNYKSSLYRLCKSYLQIKDYHNELNFIELNYGLLYDDFINKSCSIKLKDIIKYLYSDEWYDVYFNKYPSYKIIDFNDKYYLDDLIEKYENYNTNNTILNDYGNYIKNNCSKFDYHSFIQDKKMDIFEYNNYIKYKFPKENDIALLTNEDKEYLLFQYINGDVDGDLVYIESDIDINNNSVLHKNNFNKNDFIKDPEYAYTIFRKKINIIQELNKLINYDFNINNKKSVLSNEYNDNKCVDDNKKSVLSNESESDDDNYSSESEYYNRQPLMTDDEYVGYIVYLD